VPRRFYLYGYQPPATRAIPWWFFSFSTGGRHVPHEIVFRNALPWVFTFALIVNAVPLRANPPNTAATPPTTAGLEKSKTEVIADEATKTVRIVVDGRDVAVFDSKGLHVDGNIGMTGTLRPATISAPAPLGLDTASSPARNP
jgi:hypothetical protein